MVAIKPTDKKKKTRIGIVNVTGYAGAELARLLYRHPMVEITSVSGRSSAGKVLEEVFPHLASLKLTISANIDNVDLAFCALPHKESAPVVSDLLDSGTRVIDISADYRLKDPSSYQSWYGCSHPNPKLLTEAVYGLPELHRASIATARLVANPGCYSTSAILGIAPLAKQGMLSDAIIIDSKSGVSGAGRTLSLKTHYCEVNESVNAYALEGHRHLPEIEQELFGGVSTKPPITFVPHLIPMTRGILTTIYFRPKSGVLSGIDGVSELKSLYKEFYKGEHFVHIVEEPPHTKHTLGANNCLIYPTIDNRTGHIIIVSVIDNLVKGAAGQAIQNTNIMLGLPETTGLETIPIYP